MNILGGDLGPEDGGHGIETSDPDHCRFVPVIIYRAVQARGFLNIKA